MTNEFCLQLTRPTRFFLFIINQANKYFCFCLQPDQGKYFVFFWNEPVQGHSSTSERRQGAPPLDKKGRILLLRYQRWNRSQKCIPIHTKKNYQSWCFFLPFGIHYYEKCVDHVFTKTNWICMIPLTSVEISCRTRYLGKRGPPGKKFLSSFLKMGGSVGGSC